MQNIELDINKVEGFFAGFGRKSSFGTIKIFIAELFGNEWLPAIVPRYFNTVFAGNDLEWLIKV
jgi:hypothetical protein